MYELLEFEITLLDKELSGIYKIDTTPKINPTFKSEYIWTGKKCDLIEVLQGVLLLGSINKGVVKQGEFIRFIGQTLNVDLNNSSDILNNILNRQENPNQDNSRIRYLRRMIDAFDEKLQQLDSKSTFRN